MKRGILFVFVVMISFVFAKDLGVGEDGDIDFGYKVSNLIICKNEKKHLNTILLI